MSKEAVREAYRKTDQRLLPVSKPASRHGEYDLYPAFELAHGDVWLGYDALAAALPGSGTVVIDGHGGVAWDELRAGLAAALVRRRVASEWHDVSAALKPAPVLAELLAPYLGGDDPIFGRQYQGSLGDLFEAAALAALGAEVEAACRAAGAAGYESGSGAVAEPGGRASAETSGSTSRLTVVYGCGAALAGAAGTLVYVDVPKNEVQYRSRAGAVAPLGEGSGAGTERDPKQGLRRDPKRDYKRYFFVDWPVLARHKRKLLPDIDVWVDAQRPDQIAATSGSSLRDTLDAMARSAFRARPWFEAGPWGGDWLRQRFSALPRPDVNYAWSFELITPENGLLLQKDGRLLEVSFDTLMFQAHEAVLGEAAPRFGPNFPIRFNYLDTYGGGNLSLQVHPSDDYIRERFGQGFTQDETYYVTDTVPEGAQIYLGFKPGVDLLELRSELERVNAGGEALDVERFVHSVPARKHGLYLIPNGTIHSSGAGNVVLEISATTYLFTFKVYDWQRLDLDGKPRPINLERAFDNFDASRVAGVVEEELIARPTVIEQGEGWRLMHLPTHPQHFYDVHRFELEREVAVDTFQKCHVLNLVEGSAVEVVTGGRALPLNYGETAVVPAAAGAYRLVNRGPGRAMIVKAFVKDGRGEYRV